MHYRVAADSDRAALARFHRACSYDSRVHRWQSPAAAMPARYLDDALRERPGHVCLLALDGAEIVAMASVVREDHAGTWQLAVLVADAYQNRGIGRALVAALVARVRERGGRRLTMDAAPDRVGYLERLDTFGLVRLDHDRDGVHADVLLRDPADQSGTTEIIADR